MADINNSDEIWRDIPGFEGWYQASSEGRIKSLARSTLTRNRWGPCFYNQPEKIIGGRIDRHGYRKMTLCVGGKVQRVFAHRLVALAFHGLPIGDVQIAHWDGDRLNNRRENLRWATVKENAADKVRHGSTSDQFGEKHSHNKLTNDQVKEIRSWPYRRGDLILLGKKYGVTPQTIGKILRGERWPHL